MDSVTLADCIELYEYKNICSVIEDGCVKGFTEND